MVWPDDPKGWLFDTALGTQNYSSGVWWYDEFKHGCPLKPKSLIQRSHFGDLQFFHAMATESGESAAKTKKAIVDWVRFNVELARGKIKSTTTIQDLDKKTFGSIKKLFEGNSAWAIRDLLSGGPARGGQISEQAVQHRAAGILLHLIQDSFSHSHVERQKDDNSVVQFHDYGSQDSDAHAEEDKMGKGDTLKERISKIPGATDAIQTGAKVILMLDSSVATDSVVKFFEDSVFKLSSKVLPSGAGAKYKSSKKQKKHIHTKWCPEAREPTPPPQPLLK